MTQAAAPAEKKERKLRDKISRPSSPCSRWHMSSKAVDRSVLEYGTWSNLQCVQHLATIRWGSFKEVVCPHCSTADTHYWRKKELRWKCKHCGKTAYFSPSWTPFQADRGRHFSLIVDAVSA